MFFVDTLVESLILFVVVASRLLAFAATILVSVIFVLAFIVSSPLVLSQKFFTGLADVLGDYK
ncbi:hypothetical protein UFOVP244_58 [uncultured Caudovirales phage]|uniref:Uncharacterized protein n=1 Tax=uncultured Caudovirales phage TaxID=2100421 RepID=A0A6J7WVV8_9CAUD|nr:hypothetical protein UFOVP244_58 [uncultured Caudovirales phage]